MSHPRPRQPPNSFALRIGYMTDKSTQIEYNYVFFKEKIPITTELLKAALLSLGSELKKSKKYTITNYKWAEIN